MRCLTLADALTAAGAECHFLTRPHDGHMITAIDSRGHRTVLLGLPGGAFGQHPAPPAHAAWLGGDWRRDAAETRAVLDRLRPDWVIVDHYALDRSWEEDALPPKTALMAIDDLADRPHRADMLLDQNFGRRPEDYEDLVPDPCTLLIGPRYALLRPDFPALRPRALARRAGAQPRHLLVTLGGVDKDNVTGAVLSALAETPLSARLQITVVMGRMAPWLDRVLEQATTMPCPARVLPGVSNMAELMTEVDFCIGAAGGTTWERCVLGLPTLLIVLAENQRPAARALAGASVCLEITPDREALETALRALEDPAVYAGLSRRSADLTDGAGTCLVLKILHGETGYVAD